MRRLFAAALMAASFTFGIAKAKADHAELIATLECEAALTVYFNLAGGATVLALILTPPENDTSVALAIAETVEETRSALRIIALRRQRAIDALVEDGADETSMTNDYERVLTESTNEFWTRYEQALENPSALALQVIPVMDRAAQCRGWQP